jgi:hypothetical protein
MYVELPLWRFFSCVNPSSCTVIHYQLLRFVYLCREATEKKICIVTFPPTACIILIKCCLILLSYFHTGRKYDTNCTCAEQGGHELCMLQLVSERSRAKKWCYVVL